MVVMSRSLAVSPSSRPGDFSLNDMTLFGQISGMNLVLFSMSLVQLTPGDLCSAM